MKDLVVVYKKVDLATYLKTVGLYFYQLVSKTLFERLDATLKTCQVLTLPIVAIKCNVNSIFVAKAFVNYSEILLILQLPDSELARKAWSVQTRNYTQIGFEGEIPAIDMSLHHVNELG